MNWKTAHRRAQRRRRQQMQAERLERSFKLLGKLISQMFRDREFVRRLISGKYSTGRLLPSISPRSGHYMIGSHGVAQLSDGSELELGTSAPDYQFTSPEMARTLLARSLGVPRTTENPDGTFTHQFNFRSELNDDSSRQVSNQSPEKRLLSEE